MNVRSTLLVASAISCSLGFPGKILAQDWLYTFRQGDTLWDLCIKYSNKRGCWIELGKYNHITDGRAIRPGEQIRFPQVWLSESPVVGRADSVRGEVSYQERFSTSSAALVAGQDLLLGSRIVSRDGTAQITIGHSSTLRIRPHSELELDSLSTGQGPGQSSELSLDGGDVEVEVEPASRSRFQIKTPAAIAAVRGTQYRVSSRSGGEAFTRGEVLAGAVEVSGVGATLVPAGFGVLAKQGKPLDKPRKLLPPPAFQYSRLDAPLPLDIRWQADPGAVSWQMDLLLGNEKTGELSATYKLTEPGIEFTTLDKGCYSLVLRGIDGEGFNGLESHLPICVIDRLPAPADIAIERPEDTGQPYRLSWSPVAGAGEYRLEVAADANFDQLISSQVVTGSAAELALPGAERFSVRVVAIDQFSNDGTFSSTENYVEPDYVTLAVVTTIFLLIVML